MSNAHKVHGVLFSSNGQNYTSIHREALESSDTGAWALAEKLASGDTGEFGAGTQRNVNSNTNLLFDFRGISCVAYIAIFLFKMKDKFLVGEPVSNLPTIVVGEMKSFFTVASCSDKHILLKVDMAEVIRQKGRLEAAAGDNKHTLTALPICLNIVHDPFGSSLPIIGHTNKDDDEVKSSAGLLTHGGFHPPVAYVQV